MPKPTAVYALSWATCTDSRAAPSIRLNALSTPLSSTTAITNGWPISVALRSAASIIAFASSVVTLGRSNVAAIRNLPLPVRGRVLRDVALLDLAHLGQPDEIKELAERRKLAHDRGRRSGLAISRRIRRMAAVAASSVPIGKMTIR